MTPSDIRARALRGFLRGLDREKSHEDWSLMADYEKDSLFWQLLAFSSGTGGSALIIGSAAGVAVMGVLRIDFGWYLKNMSLLAILGYASGVLVYYIQQSLVG